MNDFAAVAWSLGGRGVFLAVRAALHSGRTIDPVDAADVSTPLKRLPRELAGTIVSVPA
jgi:hypothetical protein